MDATRAPSLAGLSCRGTEGPTRAVTTLKISSEHWTTHFNQLCDICPIYLLGCTECHRCFSFFSIWIWKQDYPLQTPVTGKLKSTEHSLIKKDHVTVINSCHFYVTGIHFYDHCCFLSALCTVSLLRRWYPLLSSSQTTWISLTFYFNGLSLWYQI